MYISCVYIKYTLISITLSPFQLHSLIFGNVALCSKKITIKMVDIFDNTILCKGCNAKMKAIEIERNGFFLRAVECEKCKNKIIHPLDKSEYEKFMKLRNKTFKVKMRIVGNSYAVSIPKEIVNFIKEQEKIMNDMVRLCFNDSKKLSLFFGEDENKEDEMEKEMEE